MEEYREQMLFGGASGSDEPAGGEDIPGDSSEQNAQGDHPGEQQVRATPAARRLARKHEIPLSDVAQSMTGVIREEDVQDYLDSS